MTRLFTGPIVMLVVAPAGWAADRPAAPLLFHASFDGTLEARAQGNGRPVKVEGTPTYRPGKSGQALLAGEAGTLVHYASAGNLRATAGAIEMWVCPLDWTGQKDAFHAFFEARSDHGWLLLYRYYQGGILMLTGLSAATYEYRTAGSSSIRWTPGQWHHLVGTWRPTGQEAYIDGQRVGFSPDPLLPRSLPETFQLGDHPWHVPRREQTLIDEVKIYAFPLDADSVARAARGDPIAPKPKAALRLQPHPQEDRLEVICDAAGLVGDLGPVRQAQVAILPKGQPQPKGTGTIASFAADAGRVRLPLADLPPGDHLVRVTLADAAGRPLHLLTEPFYKPGPPVWQDNRLGLDDKLLPPWTALEVAGDGTVACWGRQHRFGLGLASVRSAGVELLAAPVQLEARIGGQAQRWTGEPCRVVQSSATRATLAGRGRLGPFSVEVRHEIEFDGFLWTDLTLQPAGPVKVEELCLTWAMPADQATLMNAVGHWNAYMAGSVPAGKGWHSAWLPHVWVGNEERGLCWCAESPQHWTAAPDKPAFQLVPEADRVRIFVRLIAAPTEITRPVRYGWGLMATPAKPRPADARQWRMKPAPRATIEIIWPNNNMKYYGYPEPIEPDRFKARVQEAHAQGVQVVPYVNLNYISDGVPDWRYYGPLWKDSPVRVATPSDVAAMGYASVGTAPSLRPWQDYILFRINEMIDRYAVDGIYIDCWGTIPSEVGSAGWTDAAGRRHPTRPIRAYREILRRVYALFRDKRPNPHLQIHMSTELVVPILTFADSCLDGEQFRTGKLKDDYLDLLPPDKFRAEFMGHNMGLVAFFLPELREPYVTSGTWPLAVYLLLHDVNAWPIWSDVKVWNRFYEAVDAFGLADAKFQPYWKPSAGVHGPEPVLISAFCRPGKALLAVMNTGEATEARVSVDPAALGLAGLGAAIDLGSNSRLAIDGRGVTLPLKARGAALVELRERP